ncbi:hypothetical protein BDW68DRAFT_172528 [Aspergillus falconensis]
MLPHDYVSMRSTQMSWSMPPRPITIITFLGGLANIMSSLPFCPRAAMVQHLRQPLQETCCTVSPTFVLD